MKTTTWIIDPSHTIIQFKVKHLMITTVTGNFKDFKGTLESGNAFEDPKPMSILLIRTMNNAMLI